MTTIENQLSNYLSKIAQKEAEIEIIRQNLATDNLFVPEYIFSQLDHNHKGFLCLNDIFQFMQYIFFLH